MKPFGMRDKLGYMFGDFGNDFFFMLASSFLMVFYTNVLGVSGAVVGTLFLVARCVDGVTDFIMGRIIDRVKPAKDGKFRPWIRRMCVPVVLAGILMFLPQAANLSYGLKIVFIYVTYFLWGSVCYTGINIPYGSMASVMTADAVERSQLSKFRSVGAALAGVIVSVGVPMVIYVNGADGKSVLEGSRFLPLTIVFAILALTCYILCYSLTTERVKSAGADGKPAAKPNFAVTLKGIAKNRALISIVVIALVLLLSMLTASAMNTYLYIDYFGNRTALQVAGFLSTGCTLILAPFTTPIIAKFGKKESAGAALLVASVAYAVMFFSHITNPWIYIAMVFIGNLGSGYFNIVVWAFIIDAIDMQELITGVREDATIYAVYSFARKLGQALAGGIGGFALTAIGYLPAVGGVASVQSESTIQGIYSVATAVPAVGYGVMALLMIFWYPLTKNKLAENAEKLAAKRAAE
ncbi:MAG: MFS transporter [Clostridia bacterium]|nr:MFS transporter [Clostridia bacterium]